MLNAIEDEEEEIPVRQSPIKSKKVESVKKQTGKISESVKKQTNKIEKTNQLDETMKTPQVKKDIVIGINQKDKLEIHNQKVLEDFENEKLAVMRLPNTQDNDSDYDDEECDIDNDLINKQKEMNKIPEETEEEEDMEAMLAENQRLREHLRKIKADKEMQDEEAKEVAQLNQGPVSEDSSDLEENSKFN